MTVKELKALLSEFKDGEQVFFTESGSHYISKPKTADIRRIALYSGDDKKEV